MSVDCFLSDKTFLKLSASCYIASRCEAYLVCLKEVGKAPVAIWLLSNTEPSRKPWEVWGLS